jgi:uncharacterized protein DUF1707
MSDPVDPAHIRIGTAERDAALDALGEHMRAGRLDPDEYSERAAQVAVARYQSDLVAVFRDLPSDPQAPATRGTGPSRPSPAGRPYVDGKGRQPLGGRGGATVVALSPFIALALFFALGAAGGYGWSWIFFLLVPVTGIIVYGDSDRGSRRRRERDRGRDTDVG